MTFKKYLLRAIDPRSDRPLRDPSRPRIVLSTCVGGYFMSQMMPAAAQQARLNPGSESNDVACPLVDL